MKRLHTHKLNKKISIWAKFYPFPSPRIFIFSRFMSSYWLYIHKTCNYIHTYEEKIENYVQIRFSNQKIKQIVRFLVLLRLVKYFVMSMSFLSSRYLTGECFKFFFSFSSRYAHTVKGKFLHVVYSNE